MGTISVLVVDDSAVVRRLIVTALQQDPEIQVTGTAANGALALSQIESLAPDVVTLDIEMPVLDGLSTLRELRKSHLGLPVIMFSTLTERGCQATFEALSAGADDYVTKPSNTGRIEESLRAVREQLVPKIKALHAARSARRTAYRAGGRPSGAPAARPVNPVHPVRPATAAPAVAARAAAGRAGAPRPVGAGGLSSGPVDLLAVGCSTGGPEALAKVLAAMPASLAVPVVVVQHMPPLFTRMFAERLHRGSKLHVSEATEGVELVPGHVYVAPGDYHLEVVRSGQSVRARLHQEAPENFCRPAVDVLFRSVAAAYGSRALAVVLTGMGSDGRKGAEVLRRGGGRVIAQDEPTSVVWGMPGAVANAGLADAVLPLEAIAPAVLDEINRPAAARRQAAVS